MLGALLCSKPTITAMRIITTTIARPLGSRRSTPSPPRYWLRIRVPSRTPRVSIPRMAKSGQAPRTPSITTIIKTADGPDNHKTAVARSEPSNAAKVSITAENAFDATSWAGESANHGSRASWIAFGAECVNPSMAIGRNNSTPAE